MKNKLLAIIKSQPLLFILLLIFVSTLFQLGSWGLTETSEARYAQIAKEMIESGDYIHPTKMGILHYHKPPLTYYITALGYQLFGINEFGARFFLSIALLVQLVLIYKTSQLLFDNKRASILAVVLYFSTPLILGSIRNLTTDAYLNTFVLMAVYFWLKYQENKKYFWIFYLSLGLGFLTKGPLVFIPVLVFQLVWLYYNRSKVKFSKYDLWGIVVFFLSCGWWYWRIINENPLVFDYFTGDQIYQRMVSNDAYSRGKPFWYYLVLVPVSLFPWVVYLFMSFKKIAVKSKRTKILGTTFIIIILIFSLFKTKLIFYILPSLSFLILFVSNLLTEVEEKYWRKFTFFLYGYFSVLFVAELIAVLLHKIELNFLYVLILAIGIAISFYGLKNISWFYRNMYTLLINTIALVVFSTTVMSSNELLINSPKPIANFINTLPTENIYIYNYLVPSMSFYTSKNVITLNNGNYTSKREVQFEKNSNYLKTYYNLESKEEIARLQSDFKIQNSVFLFRKKETLPEYIKAKLIPFKNKKDFGKWILYYN